MGSLSSTQQRVLGRYVLYGELASGGMATVHFGRLLGAVGFARTVAIKRLHAHYARDPEVVAMFLDEATLAARIRHPNVVPTIDVVATEGEVFLVMEYVQGVPLSHLLRAAGDKDESIPPNIVVSIMVDALHGLHAAHEATNDLGEPLHIVHRDVSPQNVLIGVDGVARVLDFGVAKAIGRLHTTRDGRVKGKIAYMAPEHLTGRSVSPASDVFAAAVVLWEALTGQRLFGGGDDGQVIYRILSGPIDPPSRLQPGLPPLLDEVTLRGLSRGLVERYATAKEMALALERSLPRASVTEVGEYVTRVASTLLGDRSRDLATIESDETSAGHRRLAAQSAEAPTDPDIAASTTSPRGATDRGGARRRRVVWLGAALAAVGASAGMGFIARHRTPNVDTGGPSSATSSPSAAAPLPPESAAPLPSVAEAPLPTVAAPPKQPNHPPVHNPAAVSCDPPFTLDSAGYRHYKRACIR